MQKELISIGLSDTAEFLRHLPAARAGRGGAAPGKSLWICDRQDRQDRRTDGHRFDALRAYR